MTSAGDEDNPDEPTRAAGTAAPGIASAHPDALADVLASIRTLVSAEAAARLSPNAATDGVLMLTPEMRVDEADDGPELDAEAAGSDRRPGAILSQGLGSGSARRLSGAAQAGEPAPILDEESLRAVVNAIVREELQGELGDRIARNLRKLIRRELAEMHDGSRET